MRAVTWPCLLAGWLRSRRPVFCFFALFSGILLLVYGLYGYPWGVARYTLLLELFAACVCAAVDFARWSARCRALSKLAGRFPLGGLPPARDRVAEAYEAVIRAQEEERLRLTAESESRRRDAEQYYTLWAHQIKTPIAAMRLLSQQRESGGEAPGFSAELLRVEQYVDMVLQYQRLGSLHADLLFERFAVEVLARRAVKGLAPLFIGSGLALELGALEGELVTDSKWFVFVVEQLLTNAVKYTRQGAVRVFTEQGRLVVEDTGVGISPEDLPRVFERGFTGAAGRIDRRSTGIGLYLCKEIAARLGLGIEIASEPGKGTRVLLDLRQTKPDELM